MTLPIKSPPSFPLAGATVVVGMMVSVITIIMAELQGALHASVHV